MYIALQSWGIGHASMSFPKSCSTAEQLRQAERRVIRKRQQLWRAGNLRVVLAASMPKHTEQLAKAADYFSTLLQSQHVPSPLIQPSNGAWQEPRS